MSTAAVAPAAREAGEQDSELRAAEEDPRAMVDPIPESATGSAEADAAAVSVMLMVTVPVLCMDVAVMRPPVN